jgi:hypothetical protein
MAPMQFSVKHDGISLKITLDEKWLKRPLLTSVVGPFVKAFNKKLADESARAVHEDGLSALCVDGETWVDPSQTGSTALPADTKIVELFFETKEAMDMRRCHVVCGEVELKIELERKWLRQSFSAAVVAPFVRAHNKKHGSPLSVSALSHVFIDGGPSVQLRELGQPSGFFIGPSTRRVELRFGGDGSDAGVSTGGGGGRGTPGGGGGLAQLSEAELLRRMWTRLRTTEEGLASAREVRWTNLRLGSSASDGATIGRALLCAGSVRCEGSWGSEGLGNLLTLELCDNELGCDGVKSLVECGALSHSAIPNLRDLHLQNNRIGDEGIEALCYYNKLPHLKKLQLQGNLISDDGLSLISKAMSERDFRPRHLNILENRYDPSSGEAEELREIVRDKYVELRMQEPNGSG